MFGIEEAVLVQAGISSIIALGLYVTLLSGQLSMAHAAMATVGGYVAGLLTIELEWPFALALLAAMGAGMVLGTLISLVTLRMNELVVGLTTLGVAEVLSVIALNISLIGGPQGLSGMVPLTTPSMVFFAVLVVLVVAWRIDCSRLGFGCRATRDAPEVASAMGVHVNRVKIVTFGLGGAIVGLAGGLDAHYSLFVDPSTMGFHEGLSVAIFVLIGGSYVFWGPLVGAVLLTILPEMLRFSIEGRYILYGLLVATVVMFRPEGIVKRWGRTPRRLTQANAEVRKATTPAEL